jgi:hypothetical protein
MEFQKDGLYKILHIILPNEIWAQKYEGSSGL